MDDVKHTISETRRKILNLLKTSEGLSVQELSQSLEISAMGVRQHLNILEADAFVRSRPVAEGVGRPRHVYSLTRRGHELFSRSYDAFAASILAALRALEGDGGVDAVFRKKKEQEEEEYAPFISGKSRRSQVEQLARLQSQRGYMAQVEEDDDYYVMTEHNCTISRIAEQFPQACQYEIELFRELLGVEIERVSCLAEGGSCCKYVVPK